MKSAHIIIGIVLSIILTIVVHISLNIFILPLSLISLAFFLIGFIAPELLSNVSKYNRTIWIPLLVLIAGVIGILIGTYSIAGRFYVPILISTTWCPKSPCYPLGLIPFSFVVGNILNWIVYYIENRKIDLIGF